MDSDSPATVIGTWHQAETFAAAHMVELGFDDANVTPPGADGGVDVTARGARAQVKHFANGPVGAPAVQRLIGAASGTAHGLFYSLTGYTAAAVRLAEESGTALFSYSITGDVEPWSAAGRGLVERGFVTWDTELETRARTDFIASLKIYVERAANIGGMVSEVIEDALVAAKDPEQETPAPMEDFVRAARHMKLLGHLLEGLEGSQMWSLSDLVDRTGQIEGHAHKIVTLLGVDYSEVERRTEAKVSRLKAERVTL